MQKKSRVLLIALCVFLVSLSLVGGYLIGKYTNKPTENVKPEEKEPEKEEELTDIYGDLSFKNEIITYDGKAHELKVTGNIPSTMTIFYQNNGKTEVGTYEIIASLNDSSGKYKYPKILAATLTILPSNLDIDFSIDDYYYKYTGKEIECVIPDLDERYSVTYYNNKHTEPGSYEMMAIIHDTKGDYNDIIVTATMIIGEKNEFNVVLDDMTVPYTGEEYTLLATGDVSKYNITYTNNVQINAGEYSVSATITDPNGEIESIVLIATLTITQKDMELNVTFEDKEVLFDGNSHRIDVIGIPEGFTVSYENNDKVEVGEYEITATIKDSNGNYKDTILKANLIISGDLILELSDKRFPYDGEPHMLEVTGTLNPDIEIKYYDDDTDLEVESYTELGTYNIRAEVVDKSGKYNSQTLKAQLMIVESHRVVFRYDGATIKTIYVEHGGDVEDFPELPVEEGYILSWKAELDGPTNVKRDLVFNVTRALINYTITYVTTYDVSSLLHSYYKTSTDILLGSIEVDGYVFVGWFLDQEYTLEIDRIEANHVGDITLYPYLVPRTYSISYYVNNTLSDTVNVVYNNPVRIIDKKVGNATVIKWINENENITLNPNQKITYEYSKDIRLDAIIVDTNYSFDVSVVGKKVTLNTYLGSGISGDENVLIPQYYFYENEWLPVEKINVDAFKNYANKTQIQSVVIPEGIKRIDSSAFEGLTSLEYVELPNTLNYIGSAAFKNCTNLVTINLESVTTLGSFAFQYCTNLHEVNCSNLTVLATGVFDNSGVNKIYLKNITNVMENALNVTGSLSIYYDGSKAQFDALNLSNLPTGYALYCKVNNDYVLQ